MGATAVVRALLMLLHERWAVLTVVLTAFGRAIAEVGAVMIVGGNIDGVTRVMTTSMALETSKGDLPLAMALGLLLLATVASINVAISGVRAWGSRSALTAQPAV
jgi:tungstate transport system permease protein